MADEPVSALDVSVKAQILNLLKDIQEEYGIAYLFVSHDLRVIRHVSDVVAVMYLGKLMEVSPAEEMFGTPLHPYTRSLLSAVPMIGGATREKIVLRGEIPSPLAPPPGCRFHTRCFMAEKVCEEVCPPFRESAWAASPPAISSERPSPAGPSRLQANRERRLRPRRLTRVFILRDGEVATGLRDHARFIVGGMPACKTKRREQVAFVFPENDYLRRLLEDIVPHPIHLPDPGTFPRIGEYVRACILVLRRGKTPGFRIKESRCAGRPYEVARFRNSFHMLRDT